MSLTGHACTRAGYSYAARMIAHKEPKIGKDFSGFTMRNI